MPKIVRFNLYMRIPETEKNNVSGIVHCWRIDNFQHFHSFNILDSDEEVEELPVISWNTGSTTPMVASGGRGLQLRIWSPTASTRAKDDKKGSVLGGDSFTEVRLFFI